MYLKTAADVCTSTAAAAREGSTQKRKERGGMRQSNGETELRGKEETRMSKPDQWRFETVKDQREGEVKPDFYWKPLKWLL